MNQHPIYLSDTTYRLLAKRAAQENRSLQQVAELLLHQELTLPDEIETGAASEALEAVSRLTTLFADVKAQWVEQALADPMIELANADLDIVWQ